MLRAQGHAVIVIDFPRLSNGAYELTVKNADKLDYLLTLIKQSYMQKA